MDLTVSKTIEGFSNYVDSVSPDLIVVHGDRPEPLACAIVGSFKNIVTSSMEELVLCPGLGPIKVRNLHDVFNAPL